MKVHGSYRQWLRRMGRGHEPSARLLWSALAPKMQACARGVLSGTVAAGEVDDAVQRAFCKVLDAKQRDLKRVRDVEAWLVTLARRSAIDLLRAHQRRSRRESASAGANVPDGGGREHGLGEALAGLEPGAREVLMLRHAAGLSFAQIGEVLGQGKSTVADRHARATLALREAMGLGTGEEGGAA